MSRISAAEVEIIATLARLELGPQEALAMARDLDRVLEYVATLDVLDTSGIEPTAHAIALETPVREDKAAAPMDAELAVACAPKHAGTAFVVPKVLDEDEG